MHVALLSSIVYLSIFSKVAVSIESEVLVEVLPPPPPDEIGLVSECSGSFELAAESGLSEGGTTDYGGEGVDWGGGTGEV